MILAAIALAACSSEAPPTPVPPSLATDFANYKVEAVSPPSLPSGYHGITKVTAEHGFNGDPAARFVAQGAGSLIVDNDRWFVVTARHVVVPNPETKSVAERDLGSIRSLEGRVAIASLGLQPTAIWFSTTADVAALELRREDRSLLLEVLDRDRAAPVALSTSGRVQPGATVEAWGFPAKHMPQVQMPVVSAVRDGFFVLNQALARGFSGGPVLADRVGKRELVGVVTRADDDAQQTSVLDWSTGAQLIKSTRQSTLPPHLLRVELPGSIEYRGIPLYVQ